MFLRRDGRDGLNRRGCRRDRSIVLWWMREMGIGGIRMVKNRGRLVAVVSVTMDGGGKEGGGEEWVGRKTRYCRW